MSILVFIGLSVAGLFATMLVAPLDRVSRATAVAAIAAVLACGWLLDPHGGVAVGDIDLAMTPYAQQFLTVTAACGLLLVLVGIVADWADRLAPAILATLAALGLALTSSEPTVCLAAAAVAAAPAALVATRVAGTPLVGTVGGAELRILGLVVGASLFAAAVVLNPSWNTDDPTFVWALAMVGLATAVAVRFGAFPFHVPAAMLSRSGAGLAVALSLAWIPAGLAVVALSWNASSFGFAGEAIDRAVFVIVVVAVATLVFGAIGALLHDEVGEVAVYSIVQDAGLVLLALASRADDVATWGRVWLVALVAAKTALIAWAEIVSWQYGTSSLGELRGWARRSPLLGLALVAIALGTVGWPGSPVYEARTSIVALSLPDPLHFAALAATLLSLAVYARLLAVGTMGPSDTVAAAAPGWLRWPTHGREPGEDYALPDDDEADDRANANRAGRRLADAWRLNRPLEAAFLVLAAAVLAVTTAFGSVGIVNAAQSGIGLDQATGVGPIPDDTNGQPEPTIAPEPSPGPQESAGPTDSPAGDPGQAPQDGSGASAAPDSTGGSD